MGWNIRRIGPDTPRIRRSSRTGSRNTPILDDKLRYSQHPDEEWSFEDGLLKYNGENVNDLINENYNEPRNLIGISTGLARYRNFVWNNGGKKMAKFNGQMEGMLGKVTSRISTIFEEKTHGMRCEYIDGSLWINGINVTMLLDLYRAKPTPKIRQYLLIWRSKLILLLSRDKAYGKRDGWFEPARKLFIELEATLKCYPNSQRLLAAPAGH